MDREEREILEKTLRLTEENNKMLHKVRRVQKLHALGSVLRWVFIIGISVGMFYFLQPYMDKVQTFMQGTNVKIDQLKNIFNNKTLPR